MDIIGLLPCAGLGLRMRPLNYPKELLPIVYSTVAGKNGVRPKLSIEFSLEAYIQAGVRKCYVIVPDWKPEIMRYLGDGSAFGIDIAYLHNSKANGLADAVFSMEPWANNGLTCLALPDTQFSPQNAFAFLLDKWRRMNADLVLGIFPTDEPQHLAPVELDPSGKILAIQDKPKCPKFMNTWGLALWNANFWALFKSVAGSILPGSSISDIFQLAIENGLRVYGVHFEDGFYYDIGKIDKLPFVLR